MNSRFIGRHAQKYTFLFRCSLPCFIALNFHLSYHFARTLLKSSVFLNGSPFFNYNSQYNCICMSLILKLKHIELDIHNIHQSKSRKTVLKNCLLFFTRYVNIKCNIRNAVYDSFYFSMLKTTETRSTPQYRTTVRIGYLLRKYGHCRFTNFSEVGCKLL